MKTKVKTKMSSLSFMITDKCNLKCSFCSRNANINNANFMQLDFIKNQIEEVLKWNNDLKTINLSGGEPFLHPQFKEILEYINSKNLNIRINTNGLFLTDKNIELLKKYNANMFTISLDSYIPEKHDKIRGVSGSFKKTVEGIKKCVKNNFKVFIKATINEENVDDLLELMKFVEDLGVYGFSFSRTIPIGRASDSNELSRSFIMKYLDTGKRITEYSKNSKLELLVDDPLRHLFDVRALEIINKNIDLSNVWGGCTAGCKFLYIKLNKDVVACTAIEEPCGNLNNETLEEIWNNSLQLKELRTRDNLKGSCSKCYKKYLCGGCRAFALATTGDLLGEDLFCKEIKKL